MEHKTLLAYRDESIGTLDDLLDLICVELQLTRTQFLDAEGKYQAIGRWLAEGNSPLADQAIRIYPQGSMALGTTVRPRGHEEFDLETMQGHDRKIGRESKSVANDGV
jgi:hypothetical protein